jgi:hypothetical protein
VQWWTYQHFYNVFSLLYISVFLWWTYLCFINLTEIVLYHGCQKSETPSQAKARAAPYLFSGSFIVWQAESANVSYWWYHLGDIEPIIIHNLCLSTQPFTELCIIGVSRQVFLHFLGVVRRNIITVLQIIFIISGLLWNVLRSVYQLCCCLGREKPQTVLSTRFVEELTFECYVFICNLFMYHLQREGLSTFNKIYEFECNIFNQRCQMIMTSVSGHLLQLEFTGSYRNWQACSPMSLFDAPVKKYCPQDYQQIKVFVYGV